MKRDNCEMTMGGKLPCSYMQRGKFKTPSVCKFGMCAPIVVWGYICPSCTKLQTPSQYKDDLFRYIISIKKIGRSGNDLTFVMGFHILEIIVFVLWRPPNFDSIWSCYIYDSILSTMVKCTSENGVSPLFNIISETCGSPSTNPRSPGTRKAIIYYDIIF